MESSSNNKGGLSAKQRFHGTKYGVDVELMCDEIDRRYTEYMAKASMHKQLSSSAGVKPGKFLPVTCKNADELVRFNLYCLEHKATFCRLPIYYGPQEEQTSLLWPGGSLQMRFKTSGITWVGVNAAGPTWVAALAGVDQFSKHRKQLSTSTLVSKSLGEMAGTHKFRPLMPPGHQKGPYAVVSVAPHEDSPNPTSVQLQLASSASDFLQTVLSGNHLPSGEVKEIVVHALELLVGQNLMPDAVEVGGFGFGKDHCGTFVGKLSDFDPVCFD